MPRYFWVFYSRCLLVPIYALDDALAAGLTKPAGLKGFGHCHKRRRFLVEPADPADSDGARSYPGGPGRTGGRPRTRGGFVVFIQTADQARLNFNLKFNLRALDKAAASPVPSWAGGGTRARKLQTRLRTRRSI